MIHVTNIDIFYLNDDGFSHPLPCAIDDPNPRFYWSVPDECEQQSFVFEMRSTHLNATTGTCSYYIANYMNPSTEEETEISATPAHTYSATVPMSNTSWNGACEVRLRLFDRNGNEWTTHEHLPNGDSTRYDFEPEHQGVRWGSMNDNLYFCYDSVDSLHKSDISDSLRSVLLKIGNGADSDGDPLSYTMQISDTPLFGDGTKKNAEVHEMEVDQSLRVEAFFDGDNGLVLSKGRMYYVRARVFDGWDYSDWCAENAFTVIDDVLPSCQIKKMLLPYSENADGVMLAEDRPNGEILVTVRVDDPDDRYVQAWLMFTGAFSQTDASFLGVSPTANSLTLYSEESSKYYVRAVTEENSLRIPTNTDVVLTWQTRNSLRRYPSGTAQYPTSSTVQHAFLYLFATDGNGIVRSHAFHGADTSSNPFEIRGSADNGFNFSIGLSGGGNPIAETFFVEGEIKWILAYPMMPESILRTLTVHTLPKVVDPSNPSQQDVAGGGIGYVDGDGEAPAYKILPPVGENGEWDGTVKSIGTFRDIAELRNLMEDKPYSESDGKVLSSLNYLQRTIQKRDFTISRYKKYATYYDGESTVTISNSVNLNGERVVRRSDGSTKTVFEYGSDGSESTDPRYCVRYKSNGSTFDEDDEDTYGEGGEPKYAVVSFCPYCNELHILQTKVMTRDGRLHDSVSDAFGGITHDDGFAAGFDGTPYSLVFVCTGCRRVFPMELKYQTHLAYGLAGLFKKDGYAYWHGYNSDARINDNAILQRHLALTRKTDYELMVRQWKEEYAREHGLPDADFGDEVAKCPYTFAEIRRKSANGVDVPTMVYGDDREYGTAGDGNGNGFNKEEFGLMPEDALLTLDPRPEFDAYSHIVPPRVDMRHDRLYIDGAKLNASIEKDYMYGFEPTEGTSAGDSLTGEAEEGDEGDPAMTRLALQGPWWAQNRMAQEFFEGAKSMKNAKDGYLGAPSGAGREEEGSAEDSGDGIEEYRVIAYAGTEGDQRDAIAVVNVRIDDHGFPTSDYNATPCSVLFHRMELVGKTQFPITVQRGVNDRYRCRLNGSVIVEGSVLDGIASQNEYMLPDDEQDAVDTFIVDFPYHDIIDPANRIATVPQPSSLNGTGTVRYDVALNGRQNAFMQMLRNLSCGAFDVPDSTIPQFKYDVTNGDLSTLSNFNCRTVDLIEGTIGFCLYGSTDLSVQSLKEGRYVQFEILPCENSAYDALGVEPYSVRQDIQIFRGAYSEDGGDSVIKTGEFPKNPDIEGEPTLDDNEEEIPKDRFYYTERKTTKRNYDVQESPIDNSIEDFESITPDGEGARTFILRKPSETSASGEPLYTCYRDEVDSRGYHFKFTPEDYAKTGRIFVRKSIVVPCNPFPLDGFGYRDWTVVPIDGKQGRYHKKKVLSSRGAPAVPRIILVQQEEGEEPVEEIGWFASESESAEPLSHDPVESSSSSDGGQQDEDEPKVYKRKGDYTWRNKILPKTCVVFDYVDISEAMCKNPFTPAGQSPLNHVCPINFGGGIYDELYRNRYGIYVLGGYDLTEQQKTLQNNDLEYTVEKEYPVPNTDQTQTVVFSLPNNWRPNAIAGFFDVVREETVNGNFLDITTKTSDDSEHDPTYIEHTYKTVNSYERYKKAWEGKLDLPNGEYDELAQYTVEQFNPAFHGHIGIWNRYGYQPEKTLQSYWKEDTDGIYEGKNIPKSSRMVHGMFEDPYADERIRGFIEKDRHIVSDKTFIKVDETYDKLPWLDYRMTGWISLNVFPYFSGYPRSEHPLYATRPEPPYPYDRQWRIGGWVAVEREQFAEQARKYNEWKESGLDWMNASSIDNQIPKPTFELRPGASIDMLLQYTANHAFLYLQREWNNYNRLHWSLDGGDNALCLYAAKYIPENGTYGSEFSVKTYSSEWNDGIGEHGAWVIGETLSDMIDMQENVDSRLNLLFENGKTYKFILRMYSYSNGSWSTTGGAIESPNFSVSRTAISPATIVSTDYDPWTRMLTINFRFDDALGRDYDIVGFKYILDDGIDSAHFTSESDFVTPSRDGNGTEVLVGNLLDLASNVKTRQAIAEELMVTHSVKVNIESLGIYGALSNMRVMLMSALSADRYGLTLPLFTVKMWANEFLKPVEEQLMSLQGYKSNWQWVERYDDATGTYSGSWEYLDDSHAVVTMGKIQEAQDAIDELSDEFDRMYIKISSFHTEATGDIDDFEHSLKSISSDWNTFYYEWFFLTYLLWHSTDDYYGSYAEYRDSLLAVNNNISDLTAARKWLQRNSLETNYEAWYLERRISILLSYRNSLASPFTSSARIASSLSDAWVEYARLCGDDYIDYISSSSSSSESQEDESSDSSEIEILPSEALDFIESTGRQMHFISYWSSQNRYADTRFVERALIMNLLFGVKTTGVWESEATADNGQYSTWLSANPSYASLPLSDKYQLFLAFAADTQIDVTLIHSYEPDPEQEPPSVSESRYNPNGAIVNESTVAMANVGRNLAFSEFLQSPSIDGTTNSRRWQALNETLEQRMRLLYACMNRKNTLETDFRRNLVRQGYFCNGFLENIPYVWFGSDAGAVNTCFRWRVETRQYEGKMDRELGEDGEYGSFDPRYDMYYRMQMDFIDTFDSQGFKTPAVDVIFNGDDESDESRILAGIDDATDSAKTTPVANTSGNSTNYVPAQTDLVVDRKDGENGATRTTNDILDLRFTAVFGLRRSILPRAGAGIVLPDEWKMAWDEKEPWSEAPEIEEPYSPKDIDYKGAYFWRVAPYNIVERPVVDALMGGIVDSEGYAVIETRFHSDEIEYCVHQINMWYATGYKNDCPRWTRNTQSAVFTGNNPSLIRTQYNQSPWLMNVTDTDYFDNGFATPEWMKNNGRERRGEVQFLTDRPRKVEYETETVLVDRQPDYYLISTHDSETDGGGNNGFPSITVGPSGKYDKYDPSNPMHPSELTPSPANLMDEIYVRVTDATIYLYAIMMNGEKRWYIGSNINYADAIWRLGTLNENDTFQFVDSPTGATIADGINGGTNYVLSITKEYNEGSSPTTEMTGLKPVLSFIDDNIGNYDTQWIPADVERMKPFVIRLEGEYIMLSHKKIATVVNGGVECPSCVITISMGFSSDVFGEEGMCIPRYTFESVGDYVKDGTRKAVSVENPGAVRMNDGTWRMYFNATFFDESTEQYYSRIFKADTVDFDEWTGISMVSMRLDETELKNQWHPHAMLESHVENDVEMRTFHMFVASNDNWNGELSHTYSTIKHFTSIDGTAFVADSFVPTSLYAEYACHSPFLLMDENSSNVWMYFTMESGRTQDGSFNSVICSIAGTFSDGVFTWRTSPYLDLSNLILEKSDAPFSQNILHDVGRVFDGTWRQDEHYSNPCVIWDTFNGCKVRRMYYNCPEKPYAYYEGVWCEVGTGSAGQTVQDLIPNSIPTETVIKTEFLDMYNWTSRSIGDSNKLQYSIHGEGEIPSWNPVVQPSSGYSDPSIYLPCSSDGRMHVRFDYNMGFADPVSPVDGAIMILLLPSNKSIRCMAQGKWIDNSNVDETEAVLMPEESTEIGYSTTKYSPMNWIVENDLTVAYNEWVQETHPSGTASEVALQWIKSTKNYPRYIWWSRKGHGIYRYIGYDAMSAYNWTNAD